MLLLGVLFITCVVILDTMEKIEYSKMRHEIYLETHKEEA